MKRLNAIWGAALLLAACGPETLGTTAQADAPPSEWMAPPFFEAADVGAGAVVVSGRAEPNQRIVLTDQTGLAAAASADARGVFSIRLTARPGLSLWRIDLARGVEEARTGEWLAVSSGEGAPMVLRAGAAARPVGPAGLLATADYDGGGLLVGGRARPGQAVQIDLDGGPSQTVRADAQGWHQARFATVAAGPHRLRARTPTMTQEIPLTLTRPSGETRSRPEAAGLRIDWLTPGGAGQATWMFDPPAGSVAPASP